MGMYVTYEGMFVRIWVCMYVSSYACFGESMCGLMVVLGYRVMDWAQGMGILVHVLGAGGMCVWEYMYVRRCGGAAVLGYKTVGCACMGG